MEVQIGRLKPEFLPSLWQKRRFKVILYLETVNGLRPEDLLARPSKNGDYSVRGPLVTTDSVEPLRALVGGDKLHIVGRGNEQAIADRSPDQLVSLISRLGLSKEIRLKQIHLIADRTGSGKEASYASRFAAALTAANLQVDEIKAPLGDVRCDEKGKIWVRLPDTEDWQPSSSSLNYYAGPAIQEKHRPASKTG